MKRIGTLATYIFAISIAAHTNAASTADPYANPPSPAFDGQTAAPAPTQESRISMEVVVSGLQLPRSLNVLPSGDLIVADGFGDVRIIDENGNLSEPIAGMPPIRSVGGRGFEDFTLDANFTENRMVYFTYQAPPQGQPGGPKTAQQRTAAAERGELFQVSKVASAKLSQDLSRVEDVKIIADIKGRRIISAPDGTLYISTVGAGNERALVQDLTSYTGKVLRINNDGSIPADNPFANDRVAKKEIYEVGHRDPDGGFIHPQTGEFWMTEHGPMGGDEINIIRPGANSGWPYISYGKNYDGTEIGPSARVDTSQPLYYWFPSVAPSGLMMYTGDLFPQWKGSIFMGTLSPTQGKFLVRLQMNGSAVVAEEHLLVDQDRRVRAITQGINGELFVLTDSENNNQTNRHFEGQVLKLTPAQ